MAPPENAPVAGAPSGPSTCWKQGFAAPWVRVPASDRPTGQINVEHPFWSGLSQRPFKRIAKRKSRCRSGNRTLSSTTDHKHSMVPEHTNPSMDKDSIRKLLAIFTGRCFLRLRRPSPTGRDAKVAFLAFEGINV